MDKKKEPISHDVAVLDFDRWSEEWDIDTDREYMDEDDRIGFDNMKHRIVRAIRKGLLTVSSDGKTVEQKLQGGDKNTLEYAIPKGAAWLAMDKHKDRQGMHKVFAYLGAMTGQPEKYFAGLDGRDIKLAQDISVLFLG